MVLREACRRPETTCTETLARVASRAPGAAAQQPLKGIHVALCHVMPPRRELSKQCRVVPQAARGTGLLAGLSPTRPGHSRYLGPWRLLLAKIGSDALKSESAKSDPCGGRSLCVREPFFCNVCRSDSGSGAACPENSDRQRSLFNDVDAACVKLSNPTFSSGALVAPRSMRRESLADTDK